LAFSFTDLLAALGSPLGGSLVPPIGRGFIRHLGGRRGGRSSPHVKCPGATPQATSHERINEKIYKINSALGRELPIREGQAYKAGIVVYGI